MVNAASSYCILLAMIQSSHAHLASTKTNVCSDAHFEKFPKKIQSNRQQVKMPGIFKAYVCLVKYSPTYNT